MKQPALSMYPTLKPARKRATGTVKSPAFHMKALLPTAAVLILTELVLNYTASGYSVIVITLLSVMLYTALKSGTLYGLISAVVVVIYNFTVVAQTMGLDLFTPKTLESGLVIAIVFPMLAYIIGSLKSRNDMLLKREHQARMKAEDSAQQLQFMAESMPQKIFTTLPNGKSVYMNDQWVEYTGPGKKAKNNWGSIIHPHDAKENMRVWKESLETGKPFQFEHRLKRNDGVYVWHLTRAQPLRDKAGDITYWVGSTTDIEDIRRARKLESETARLMKQRTQLMELNNAKDEFISIASHQLRTPATAVKQYINMAMDGYGGTVKPQLREFLERANSSNERQLDVINDLLKVAQVDAGKVVLRKDSVDVNDVIANILHDNRQTFAGRNQTVKYEHKKRGQFVSADPTKLRMIIENVIDNASKYSHENTIINVLVTKYRGQVRISVKDHGVGIEKTDLPKVFEKFQRLDNPLSTKVGGNGLGLYWVKKVVELHGGTITVASIINKGTTFTITLPAAG